jgi:hypothetical protein
MELRHGANTETCRDWFEDEVVAEVDIEDADVVYWDDDMVLLD